MVIFFVVAYADVVARVAEGVPGDVQPYVIFTTCCISGLFSGYFPRFKNSFRRKCAVSRVSKIWSFMVQIFK